MKPRVLELSPEKFAIALGALLVLLGAAAWLILVSPNRTKAHNLSSTIKSDQTQLRKQTSTRTTGKHAAQNHAISQALMTNRALPNVVGMPQIVLQLSRISVEEHVSLDSISPQTPVPYSGYTAIPMTIELSGDFFGVQGFLQQLLKQVTTSTAGVTATGRLYDVTSVTLTTSSTPPKVTASVIVDAFQYVPAVAPLPGTPTTAGG